MARTTVGMFANRMMLSINSFIIRTCRNGGDWSYWLESSGFICLSCLHLSIFYAYHHHDVIIIIIRLAPCSHLAQLLLAKKLFLFIIFLFRLISGFTQRNGIWEFTIFIIDMTVNLLIVNVVKMSCPMKCEGPISL